MNKKAFIFPIIAFPLLTGCSLKNIYHFRFPWTIFKTTSKEEKTYDRYPGILLSLSNADEHSSEVDSLFDYLESYSKGEDVSAKKKKFGEKFFFAFFQKHCTSCEERYGAFNYLEENWNKGDFAGLDHSFKLYSVFVDEKNKNGDSLFNYVYNRSIVANMLEETISYMSGEYSEHPYAINTDSSYINDLNNLTDYECISTPTIFLIDLTYEAPDWTSSRGVRETLFSFDGTNGNGDYAKARTLHDAWTNIESENNIFSSRYKG